MKHRQSQGSFYLRRHLALSDCGRELNGGLIEFARPNQKQSEVIVRNARGVGIVSVSKGSPFFQMLQRIAVIFCFEFAEPEKIPCRPRTWHEVDQLLERWNRFRIVVAVVEQGPQVPPAFFPSRIDFKSAAIVLNCLVSTARFARSRGRVCYGFEICSTGISLRVVAGLRENRKCRPRHENDREEKSRMCQACWSEMHCGSFD